MTNAFKLEFINSVGKRLRMETSPRTGNLFPSQDLRDAEECVTNLDAKELHDEGVRSVLIRWHDDSRYRNMYQATTYCLAYKVMQKGVRRIV